MIGAIMLLSKLDRSGSCSSRNNTPEDVAEGAETIFLNSCKCRHFIQEKCAGRLKALNEFL